MKLVKLATDNDNYVVLTDELIQKGDYYINTDSSNRYAYKKIFRATPTQLKGEPDYFKKWMRKIIGSTRKLRGVETITIEKRELSVKERLFLVNKSDEEYEKALANKEQYESIGLDFELALTSRMNALNIPTRIIGITYKEQTITSYE